MNLGGCKHSDHYRLYFSNSSIERLLKLKKNCIDPPSAKTLLFSGSLCANVIANTSTARHAERRGLQGNWAGVPEPSSTKDSLSSCSEPGTEQTRQRRGRGVDRVGAGVGVRQ